MLELLVCGPHFEKEPACSVTIQAQLLHLLSKELRSLFILELKFPWAGKGSSWAQNKVSEGQLRGSLLRESSACKWARVPLQEAALVGWMVGLSKQTSLCWGSRHSGDRKNWRTHCSLLHQPTPLVLGLDSYSPHRERPACTSARWLRSAQSLISSRRGRGAAWRALSGWGKGRKEGNKWHILRVILFCRPPFWKLVPVMFHILLENMEPS